MNTARNELAAGRLAATPAALYHPAVGEQFDPHLVHRDNETRRQRGVDPFYLPAVIGCQRNISDRKITDGPKRVYEYLIGRAGENGTCWPSFERMGKDLGKSARQVQNDIRTLEFMGLISTTRERRGSRIRTNSHSWSSSGLPLKWAARFGRFVHLSGRILQI
jgi:hypothetical protein